MFRVSTWYLGMAMLMTDTLFMRLSDVKLNKFFMVVKPDCSLGFDVAALMDFIWSWQYVMFSLCSLHETSLSFCSTTPRKQPKSSLCCSSSQRPSDLDWELWAEGSEKCQKCPGTEACKFIDGAIFKAGGFFKHFFFIPGSSGAALHDWLF